MACTRLEKDTARIRCKCQAQVYYFRLLLADKSDRVRVVTPQEAVDPSRRPSFDELEMSFSRVSCDSLTVSIVFLASSRFSFAIRASSIFLGLSLLYLQSRVKTSAITGNDSRSLSWKLRVEISEMTRLMELLQTSEALPLSAQLSLLLPASSFLL